ncbi:MAG: hypothetical protein WA160_10910 [Pseudobdellovibrio sp.]
MDRIINIIFILFFSFIGLTSVFWAWVAFFMLPVVMFFIGPIFILVYAFKDFYTNTPLKIEEVKFKKKLIHKPSRFHISSARADYKSYAANVYSFHMWRNHPLIAKTKFVLYFLNTNQRNHIVLVQNTKFL